MVCINYYWYYIHRTIAIGNSEYFKKISMDWTQKIKLYWISDDIY